MSKCEIKCCDKESNKKINMSSYLKGAGFETTNVKVCSEHFDKINGKPKNWHVNEN